MIKGAKYSYTSDSKGAYQVYEEIELTKDGQAKLNELLNDYALLATDVTEIENAKKASESESTKTESTSEENTESTENTDEQNTESTETQSTTEENSKIICKWYNIWYIKNRKRKNNSKNRSIIIKYNISK